MGQVGQVVFHTENQNVDARATLEILSRAMNVSSARLECIPNDAAHRTSLAHGKEVARERESPGHLSIDEIGGWIDPSERVCIIHFASRDMAWSGQLVEALRAEIPAEIAGEFEPCDPTLKIGPHLVRTERDNHDGEPRFALAMFSLQLEGQTTPLNGPAYRERIFNVDAITELRRRFEDAVGPTKAELVFWV